MYTSGNSTKLDGVFTESVELAFLEPTLKINVFGSFLFALFWCAAVSKLPFSVSDTNIVVQMASTTLLSETLAERCHGNTIKESSVILIFQKYLHMLAVLKVI